MCPYGCGPMKPCVFKCGTHTCGVCRWKGVAGEFGHSKSCPTISIPPHCPGDQRGLYVTQCDNSCGTYQCQKCGQSYYADRASGTIKNGHSPTCGVF